MITDQETAPATGQDESASECSLRFTHGAPTAEEIAAVTAVVSALAANAAANDSSGTGGGVRNSRIKRRRLLATAPQPWRTARH